MSGVSVNLAQAYLVALGTEPLQHVAQARSPMSNVIGRAQHVTREKAELPDAIYCVFVMTMMRVICEAFRPLL
jgi:hypothetical protein